MSTNQLIQTKSVDSMDKVYETIQETIQGLVDSSSVRAVYGDPVQVGDTLIIPAAEVYAGMGVGVGYGYGAQSEAASEKDQSVGGGGGGGGGGMATSRPVAMIVIDSGGARVEPIVDVTKIGLALLTTLGFMLTTFLRLKRGSNPRN